MKTTLGPLALILIVLGMATIIRAENPAGKSLEEKKSIAQSQHELMLLFIGKAEYDKIPAGLQKVLDLDLNGKYERFVVDEILILSDLLNQKSQFKMALKLVEMGLADLKEKESRVKLYKEAGFIYKQMGSMEKALEMFEKGKALEAEPPGNPGQ